MRKFILYSILFVCFLPGAMYVIPSFFLYTNLYIYVVNGKEIYHSIIKSKQKSKTKKLLIGDSVAWQLFPNTINNDTLNSLACNQAVGLAGHFILLNNYINAGNKIDTVYLFFTPHSLGNNLHEIYTYHYFLKPFYKNEYTPLFTKTVNQQIHKIPYLKICRHPLILISNWAPDFISSDKITHTFLSPVSIDYITKMKELSVKHNFKLIFLPPLLSQIKKPKVERINKNEIVENNLHYEFEEYFDNIIYLNDSNFVDEIHLEDPQLYLEYYKNIVY